MGAPRFGEDALGILITPLATADDIAPLLPQPDTVAPPPPAPMGPQEVARFDALVVRYRRPLLSFFQRRAAAPEDAEDLAQEVFMRLSRRFATLHWSNPDGLVFAIAANALTDHRRRERARHRDQHVEVDPAIQDDEPSAEAAVSSRQSLSALVTALDRLSPRVREVFVLCRFENLTQAQAAERLGVSVSAVEKHMMTAMARLRQAIGSSNES